MRTFGVYSHLFESQAYFAANVFPFIVGRHIHITRVIVRYVRRVSQLVQLKKIKLYFGAEAEGITEFFRFLFRFEKNASCVRYERRAVGVRNIAVHSYHSSVFGAPRQYGECVGIGVQKQVGMSLVAEAYDSRRVDGDTHLESAFQFAIHYRNVFWLPENVAKRQTNKLDVLFFNKLHYFLFCIIHLSPHRLVLYVHLLIRVSSVGRYEGVFR